MLLNFEIISFIAGNIYLMELDEICSTPITTTSNMRILLVLMIIIIMIITIMIIIIVIIMIITIVVIIIMIMIIIKIIIILIIKIIIKNNDDLFRLYDLNGDGFIQKDELQDVAISVKIF